MSAVQQDADRPLTPTEQARRRRAAQRASWKADPTWRKRQLALGFVRATAAHYPEDETFEAEVAAAIAMGRAEAAAAAARAKAKAQS